MMPIRSVDNTSSGSSTEEWQALILKGAAKVNRDITWVRNLKAYMEEAGFVDVVEKHFSWPIGPWCKDRKLKAIGVLLREDLGRVLEALSKKLLIDSLGMEMEAVGKLLAAMRKEWEEGVVHAYLPM